MSGLGYGKDRNIATQLRFQFKRAIMFLLLVPVMSAMAGHSVVADWRTASREPSGIAPDPMVERDAIVQVYGARAYNWRGYFGIHTWIATKPTNANRFTVYEVIGWRVRHGGGDALSISTRPADARWFGAEPEILSDLRGPGVDAVIQKIDAIARAYPHRGTYTVWPGPNSNTFTAFVARNVPELKLDLPPTAIGKDYLPGHVAARTPSGTGWQVSLAGLLGVMVAADEGVEMNLLGLTFGLDFQNPALKLPLAGRIDLFPRSSSASPRSLSDQ